MASSPRVEFIPKLGVAVVALASPLLTSVERRFPRQSLCRDDVRGSKWTSSCQGQMRAAPTLDLVAALRLAHDEAEGTVLSPTPE